MLVDAGLVTELRRVIESGLSSRRGNAPRTPGPNGDTCVICWEGATENESDTLEVAAMWTHYPQELPQSLDLDMPHAWQRPQVPDR